VTNNSGFWIGWLYLLALLYNYNQLWQLTISDCLSLAPLLTGLRVSSLPLWRMTNNESLLTCWTEIVKNLLFKSKSKSIATDGQSVSKSWCRAPSGAHDQIFITVWQLRSCFVGRPLCREDGSVFCICCWSLPAQSFSNPSPLGLATIFYCLRFETSIFVASYDSQGHTGGIRPRLHTGKLYPVLVCMAPYIG
jgi:hypothetical protein